MSAAEPLGEPLHGMIVRGDGRGRSLGFATANLQLEAHELPEDGIYAANATVEGLDETFQAVVSVGSNPTFPGERDRRVEVHLLDADLDLYGLELHVLLRTRLRGTLVFADERELIEQSAADVRRCRELLRAAG